MVSGIFLLPLSSVFLGVVLLSPLVIGMTSNILLTTLDTRRKREGASLVVPSKFLGMIPSGHVHTGLAREVGHVIGSLSTHENSLFLKERMLGQGQQQSF